MLTKEQLKILSVFKKGIFSKLTFKQIKQYSKQKSNNAVQTALKEFQKNKLVISEKISDIYLYSLNLENNLTLSYLNLLNELEIENKKYPKDILEKIQYSFLSKTQFFILIVFGSYAKNKQTKQSDLDVAIIVEDDKLKKELIPKIETIKRREIIDLDYHFFTINEFLEMLADKEENLGKQIYKNSIIHYGYIEYCNLIKGQK